MQVKLVAALGSLLAKSWVLLKDPYGGPWGVGHGHFDPINIIVSIQSNFLQVLEFIQHSPKPSQVLWTFTSSI